MLGIILLPILLFAFNELLYNLPFFCRRCIKFRTRLKSFVEIQNEIQSFDRLMCHVSAPSFLIVEITIPPREQIIKNVHSDPHAISFHPRDITSSSRETVSRGRLFRRRWLFNLLACGKKREEKEERGRGTRGRKEVSSSIGVEGRGGRGGERGAVRLLHIPQGKLLTVSEEMTS